MQGRKPNSPKVQDMAAGHLHVVPGASAPDAADQPATPDSHAAPAWVADPEARELWAQLLPDLLRRKQYIPLFAVELGRYCNFFAQYAAATRAMAAEGGPVTRSTKNVPMLSQHWVVANRAHEGMLRLAADLGLNPVAQVRLSGLQLDLFDRPAARATGTDGRAPATPFGQFRSPQ